MQVTPARAPVPQRGGNAPATRVARCCGSARPGNGGFTDNFQIDERFNAVTDRSQQLPTVGDWVYLQRGPYPWLLLPPELGSRVELEAKARKPVRLQDVHDLVPDRMNRR